MTSENPPCQIIYFIHFPALWDADMCGYIKSTCISIPGVVFVSCKRVKLREIRGGWMVMWWCVKTILSQTDRHSPIYTITTQKNTHISQKNTHDYKKTHPNKLKRDL